MSEQNNDLKPTDFTILYNPACTFRLEDHMETFYLFEINGSTMLNVYNPVQDQWEINMMRAVQRVGFQPGEPLVLARRNVDSPSIPTYVKNWARKECFKDGVIYTDTFDGPSQYSSFD